MESFRTTKCRAFGHPEITLQLRESSPIPGRHRLLVDYLENAVARGTKFMAGHTIQVGWSKLRLCQREDGTLGVEERELTPSPSWIESVDRALHDVWLQREVAGSVGLVERLTFPRQDDDVIVSACVFDREGGRPEKVLTRLPTDDAPEGFSGWSLTCAETADHDHGERKALPLLALAAMEPGLVQFLALPHGTTVLVLYKESPERPGYLRIAPHAILDGEVLTPTPGSYLAGLTA